MSAEPLDLEAIETQHQRVRYEPEIPKRDGCTGCGQNWPCHAADLVQWVKDARDGLEAWEKWGHELEDMPIHERVTASVPIELMTGTRALLDRLGVK